MRLLMKRPEADTTNFASGSFDVKPLPYFQTRLFEENNPPQDFVQNLETRSAKLDAIRSNFMNNLNASIAELKSAGLTEQDTLQLIQYCNPPTPQTSSFQRAAYDNFILLLSLFHHLLTDKLKQFIVVSENTKKLTVHIFSNILVQHSFDSAHQYLNTWSSGNMVIRNFEQLLHVIREKIVTHVANTIATGNLLLRKQIFRIAKEARYGVRYQTDADATLNDLEYNRKTEIITALKMAFAKYATPFSLTEYILQHLLKLIPFYADQQKENITKKVVYSSNEMRHIANILNMSLFGKLMLAPENYFLSDATNLNLALIERLIFENLQEYAILPRLYEIETAQDLCALHRMNTDAVIDFFHITFRATWQHSAITPFLLPKTGEEHYSLCDYPASLLLDRADPMPPITLEKLYIPSTNELITRWTQDGQLNNALFASLRNASIKEELSQDENRLVLCLYEFVLHQQGESVVIALLNTIDKKTDDIRGATGSYFLFLLLCKSIRHKDHATVSTILAIITRLLKNTDNLALLLIGINTTCDTKNDKNMTAWLGLFVALTYAIAEQNMTQIQSIFNIVTMLLNASRHDLIPIIKALSDMATVKIYRDIYKQVVETVAVSTADVTRLSVSNPLSLLVNKLLQWCSQNEAQTQQIRKAYATIMGINSDSAKRTAEFFKDNTTSTLAAAPALSQKPSPC